MANRIQSQKLRYLCLVSLFISIELLMKFSGLGNIPINPFLNVTLMNIPVAIGAILLGPAAGAILGAAFGLTSFIQPMSGLISSLFAIDPVNTVIMCVGMRMLMGLCVGWIFRLLAKVDKAKIFSYFAASFCAALLNTVFFMGYLVLAFYGADIIQEQVAAKGAFNWFHFVILFVGINGILELVSTTIIGGGVSKGVDYALNRKSASERKNNQ
ncbi:MAG: ECF transporter S component [Clostridiales bacterium]|nr:ECF transporter S component [Clostridiales bacterium]